MPDVFNSSFGQVVIITDPNGVIMPGKVVLAGFEPQAALISGVKYNQSTNHQFQMSLEGSVYLYVFGDAMGSVMVNGIAFPSLCNGAGEGLVEVFDYYRSNRASKNPEPIQVQIGSETISGFLTALTVNGQTVAEEPEGFLSHYAFIINSLPKD